MARLATRPPLRVLRLAGRVPAGRPTQRHDRLHVAHTAARWSTGRSRSSWPRSTARRTPPSGSARRRRAESAHADPRGARRDRVPPGLPRGPLRRRDPARRLDQRPGRRHRRPDRGALQRTRHQRLGLAGAAPARVRGPGRVVEPPRDRRLRPPQRPRPLRHRVVRRGRAVGHGPLRCRPGRAHGLVDGRQHHVRAGLPAPRAGARALRGGRGPRRHVLDDARPAPAPPPGHQGRDGRPGPDPRARRPRPDPGHHPAARRARARSTCSPTPASCSRCPTPSSRRWRSASS